MTYRQKLDELRQMWEEERTGWAEAYVHMQKLVDEADKEILRLNNRLHLYSEIGFNIKHGLEVILKELNIVSGDNDGRTS